MTGGGVLARCAPDTTHSRIEVAARQDLLGALRRTKRHGLGVFPRSGLGSSGLYVSSYWIFKLTIVSSFC